ncbi:MAG: hypothetical protein ACYC4T_03470 [Melioribacteraceae bacterium]
MKYTLLVIFVIIVGCSASKNFISKEEKLYSEKCAGCHRLYPKSELTAQGWKTTMEEMGKRAKLNDEEKKMILTYLTE